MKKSTFLLLLVFCTSFSYSQSGYLGALNGIEYKINLAPSIRRSNSIGIEDGDSILVSRLRYAYPSFQLNYSRVINRKTEITVGFEFARMNLVTSINNGYRLPDGTSYAILENLKANRIGAHFEFKYFRKGSLSPIGKFIGFSLNGGKTSVNMDDGVKAGKTGQQTSSSNLIARKHTITSTLLNDSTVFTNTDGNYFALRFVLGRYYPLGNNLTLSIGVSAPILSYYKVGVIGGPGFGSFGFDDNIRISNGNARSALKFTMHKYNRIQLRVGIKFHL